MLRGFALRSKHLSMRAEGAVAHPLRGHRVRRSPPSALPGISPTGGEIGKRHAHPSTQGTSEE
ncbi:hypothetical protein DXM21_14925 [Agrobacterium rosae]|nr:hypothetical protein DXM21_14925 [Agrobacterium rosae]KAA3517887.1 hypothetical protein DXM25_14975 [Agrobacterium rosae]MQB49427.1 hypothetical protein [Agrobacterium rosae]